MLGRPSIYEGGKMVRRLTIFEGGKLFRGMNIFEGERPVHQYTGAKVAGARHFLVGW